MPPTSNDLATIRTTLSGERTLMAWFRTALGLISFGFSIHKFMHAVATNRDESPRRLGIILTAMGTVSLLAGTIQYLGMLRSLGPGHRPSFAFYFACAGIGLGLMVFFGIALKFGPFG